MRLSDIRSTFLDFFEGKNHTVVDSSPLIPRNDPTLMFTAAGMVQFKDLFTGEEKRSYTRATTSQKCLRAGGKHNDLDNVGYTTRHHTFFEMLGNFSFGDYFKEEAIAYAWELVTKGFSINPERLVVTVYAEDDEAAGIWKKLTGFPEHKIIRIATSDNFWSMGDTGPCGPCTEIFYDHGEGIFGGPPGSKDEDGDRFTEIWNLVFMQFEKLADGRQINLPKPSVDTGMGLERIGAVLQGVHSNFETDLFKSLIEASKDLTGNGDLQQSHQVIADHLRACGFLLADGVLPSNEGRGYVLRRIMRRAMRHAHILGAKEPLMYRLAPSLVDLMGVHYPELKRAETLMISTLKQEEEKFRETLSRGLTLLNDEMSKLSSSQPLSGDVAFKLYDTYGFPVDLTADVLRAKEMTLDHAGFDRAMKAQKDAARAAWSGSGEAKHDKIWFEAKEKAGSSEFLGYQTLESEGVVTGIVQNSKLHESTKTTDKNEPLYLLFNQSPFYGESGGQMGDRGFVEGADFRAEVSDCVKPSENLIVHKISKFSGDIDVGMPAKLHVDGNRRSGLRQHHSVTHLLHAALRYVLGDHVIQKGSLVEQDRLRFDFAHTKPVTREEIKEIEDRVNKAIQENNDVETDLKTPDEAIKAGAMALFGEKYGDTVRVVSMGNASVELCGGTHVRATGDIGLFKIVNESGIASGVRRIEAVAGQSALAYAQGVESYLLGVTSLLKVAPENALEKIQKMMEDQKKLQNQISELKQRAVSGSSDDQDIETVNGIRLMIKKLEGYSTKDAKGLMDQLKKQNGSGIVLIANTEEGKVTLILGVSDDLTSRFDAAALIKKLSPLVGGQGGGGRPDLAQAGGSDALGINNAVDTLKQTLQG